MKEMREFEKAKYWQLEEGSSVGVSMFGRFVNRTDYDALLAYTKELTQRIKLLENLVAGGHTNGK
jgi:hypothetical protein